jgi:hypothetical protein
MRRPDHQLFAVEVKAPNSSSTIMTCVKQDFDLKILARSARTGGTDGMQVKRYWNVTSSCWNIVVKQGIVWFEAYS